MIIHGVNLQKLMKTYINNIKYALLTNARVNQKNNYEFLVLHCAVPAAEGGESVVLDGRTIFNDLRENAPKELEVLQGDFLWEYKGVRPGEFYHEPILRLVEGQPQWRRWHWPHQN